MKGGLGMKRVMVLLVVLFFAASVTVSFAAEQANKEQNLFKIIEGTLKPWNPKPKNQLINPLPEVNEFQRHADSIKKGTFVKDVSDGLKEGAEKASRETLRNEAVK